MPALTEIRDAAVKLLEATLPKGIKVTAFSGDLTVKTAKNQDLPLRSVFVTAVAARNMAQYGSMAIDLEAAFGAFVVTRGGNKPVAREADGLRLAEAAAMALHGATFGLPGVSGARVLRLESVDDEDFEKEGICVWSILWSQGLVLTNPEIAEDVA